MKRAWVGSGLLVGLLLCVVPAQAQVGAARGKVLDDKGKEKVIDLKPFGVMTRGSVGLKAVKAVKFV